jgi:hypothetical protein
MPISSVIPTCFKQDVLDGIHEPEDIYMAALFTSGAALDAKTTHYAGQPGEVKGQGYKAGGTKLSGRATGISGNSAYLTFDDPVWHAATFTARGALIYNASKEDRAVAVINFGQDYSCTNGTFAVTLPAAGAAAIVTVA